MKNLSDIELMKRYERCMISEQPLCFISLQPVKKGDNARKVFHMGLKKTVLVDKKFV